LSRRKIWIDLLLYPGHTLPTAAAPALVGIGLALHDHVFDFLPAFLGFLASWLIHVGGVFTDNYVLLTKTPQVREHPELSEALENGSLTRFTLRCAIIACFALALLTGPYLLKVAGFLVVVFGALGIVSSWAYAGGPFAYARLGLADPIFFLMFGVVAVVGTYYVQAAPHELSPLNWYLVHAALPADAFLLGLPVGALVTNVLLIDDIRDHEPDRRKGWRTGAVRFGVGWNRAEIGVLTALAYLAPFWFWLGRGFSPWVLLPLLTLPQATRVAWIVATRDRFEDLFPMTPKAAYLALAYAVLQAIGLAL
jgi:1,4-dihydroxy-2-naphthoate polyprenyltransferase